MQISWERGQTRGRHAIASKTLTDDEVCNNYVCTHASNIERYRLVCWQRDTSQLWQEVGCRAFLEESPKATGSAGKSEVHNNMKLRRPGRMQARHGTTIISLTSLGDSRGVASRATSFSPWKLIAGIWCWPPITSRQRAWRMESLRSIIVSLQLPAAILHLCRFQTAIQ